MTCGPLEDDAVKTYLESILPCKDEPRPFVNTYLHRLGVSFDEHIKETLVVSRGSLSAFEKKVKHRYHEYRATDALEALTALEQVVYAFRDDPAHRPLTDRAQTIELNGEVLHWVSCRPDEAVILQSNDLVSRFYTFDFWLTQSAHARWLRERLANGLFEVERLNGKYVETILLVTKRYGPHGPALLHEWLRDRFRDTKQVTTINRRTGAVENPAGLKARRICLLYDLVQTGSAVKEVDEFLRERFKRALMGAVLLYKYPGAPEFSFPTYSVLSTPLDALPDDEEVVRWQAEQRAVRSASPRPPRWDEETVRTGQDWREVRYRDPLVRQLLADPDIGPAYKELRRAQGE